MGKENIFARLTACISGFMTHGIAVSSDTMFFAESTYGFLAKDLESAFSDCDFEDRHILLNMIFFPSPEMRMKIEKLLCRYEFTREDEPYIVKKLYGELGPVEMLMPDGTSIAWIPEISQLSNFIEKLYIHRKHDEDILASFDDTLPDLLVTKALVLLRCNNCTFTPLQKQFLLDFISSVTHRKDLFFELFDLVVTILAHHPLSTSIEQYFFDQRQQQQKLLNDIEEFEQKSNKYGMEYLMMQKYQIPAESKEVALSRLFLLDTLIEEILQLKDLKSSYIRQRHLGDFSPEKDMKKLFKHFT